MIGSLFLYDYTKDMFDLKFYKLVKLMAAFHNDINDYRNHKHCSSKEDMMMVYEEHFAKLDIDVYTHNNLNVYNRLCYLYFNDYDKTKVDKQHRQYFKNIRKWKHGGEEGIVS